MTRRAVLLLALAGALAAVVVTAVVVALHVQGTVQSLRAATQVSLQPAGLACGSGPDGYGDLDEVPLLADALGSPDEDGEPGFPDDWSTSGFQVLVSDATDLRCILSIGVTKSAGATVDLRSVVFRGWAPGDASGYLLEADRDRAEALGTTVSAPDQSSDAVYRVDQTLAADDPSMTVELPFRQRPGACGGAGRGTWGVEALLRVDGREHVVPVDFDVVVRVDDERIGDCS